MKHRQIKFIDVSIYALVFFFFLLIPIFYFTYHQVEKEKYGVLVLTALPKIDGVEYYYYTNKLTDHFVYLNVFGKYIEKNHNGNKTIYKFNKIEDLKKSIDSIINKSLIIEHQYVFLIGVDDNLIYQDFITFFSYFNKIDRDLIFLHSISDSTDINFVL